MMAEESSSKDAAIQLYYNYSQYNGGMPWILGIFFSMFGWMMFNTLFNIWLSKWTEDPDNDSKKGYYLSYYAFFGVMYGLFAFFRAVIIAISSPKMSEIIHESMMSNLLFSPLNEFFDRVPLGRILNRLSKDLNSIDSNIPTLFSNVLVFFFFMICNVIVILYCTTIWVFIPIAIFLVGCNLLKGYYMKPNRELVRLEGITKSPIISCFSEILNGVATIRSYGV
jgi:ABC-type multidrug transport system fused ATPase/permease subunit